MSVRDTIAENVRRVRAAHAVAGLTYATGVRQTYQALVGNFTLHPERPESIGFDTERAGDLGASTAILKGDDSTGTTVLVDGQFVREPASGAIVARTWCVTGKPTVHLGKVCYQLKRSTPAAGNSAGADRGRS
jgi:hypothetical protein